MPSVNPSIQRFCSLFRETTCVWPLQHYLPNLTASGGIDDPKQFRDQLFTFNLKTGNILNNLTGRLRHSPRHCPVSVDAIVSQLVRNGKYEAVDRKSSRLVSQEVSDLWSATIPDPVNISDTSSRREFIAALEHLLLSKAPGLDLICPEIIIHAGEL